MRRVWSCSVMVSYFLKVAGGGDGRCRSIMSPVPWPWAVRLHLGGWIERPCCQDATWGACSAVWGKNIKAKPPTVERSEARICPFEL